MHNKRAARLIGASALLAMVAAASIPGCEKTDQNFSETVTRSHLQSMKLRLELYNLRGQSPMPSAFGEFYRIMKNDGEPLADGEFETDAWGSAYTLEVRAASRPDMLEYVLRSAGRDREMHTQDDLIESIILPRKTAAGTQSSPGA